MKKNLLSRFITAIRFLAKEQKILLVIYVLALAFYPVEYFLEWKGRGFLAEAELVYSTGVLDHHRLSGRSGPQSYLSLYGSPDYDEKVRFYGCHYSADNSISTCMRGHLFEQYLGKTVTIGWYSQPDFLWLSNGYPQIVTVSVNGVQIVTYKDTVRTINRLKRFDVIALFFLMSFIILVCKLTYSANFRVPLENKSDVPA